MEKFDSPFTHRRLLGPRLIDRILSLFCPRLTFSLSASLPTYGESGYCICRLYTLQGVAYLYSVDLVSTPTGANFTLPDNLSEEIH